MVILTPAVSACQAGAVDLHPVTATFMPAEPGWRIVVHPDGPPIRRRRRLRLRDRMGVCVLALLASGVLSEVAKAEAEAAQLSSKLALVVPEPESWLPDNGRGCIKRGRYRGFCQGPRRAPAPHGPAAALSDSLGLGDQAVRKLLHERLPMSWRRAAPPITTRRLLWPVRRGRLFRGFGRVRRAAAVRHKPHNGFDIVSDVGTPIRAAQAGLVAYSDNGVRGFGNLLILVHRDGSTTLYAHCQATLVFPGETVTRGQVVALLGATGIARGPHLHFEYRKNGHPRNPRNRFAHLPKQALRTLRRERRRLASGRR